MTTFYIVRHAHKEVGNFYNPALRHLDEPISTQGKEAAQILWSFFSDKQIAAIYTSCYVRTAQTIEYVAHRLNMTRVMDERLNEIDNGRVDGMSDEAIREIYPHVWNGFRARSADFRFPDGETGEEARQRLADFLEEKRAAHDGEQVIAVCHEGLIRLAACHILGLPVYDRWNFRVDFCGIMEISYRPDYQKWQLVRFNQQVL